MFDFLKLPTELRLMVYKHYAASCAQCPVVEQYVLPDDTRGWKPDIKKPTGTVLALMMVNKAIYNEYAGELEKNHRKQITVYIGPNPPDELTRQDVALLEDKLITADTVHFVIDGRHLDIYGQRLRWKMHLDFRKFLLLYGRFDLACAFLRLTAAVTKVRYTMAHVVRVDKVHKPGHEAFLLSCQEPWTAAPSVESYTFIEPSGFRKGYVWNLTGHRPTNA